jgi:hypothetical protein
MGDVLVEQRGVRYLTLISRLTVIMLAAPSERP